MHDIGNSEGAAFWETAPKKKKKKKKQCENALAK
jgi:hypothetical protein